MSSPTTQVPAIENALEANRGRLTSLFQRQATLLATAAGVMQAPRMLRESPDPEVELFQDEDEALAWASDSIALP